MTPTRRGPDDHKATWDYAVAEEPILGSSFRGAGQETPSLVRNLEAMRSCLRISSRGIEGTASHPLLLQDDQGVPPVLTVSVPVAVVIHHKPGGLSNTNLWYSSGGQTSEMGFSSVARAGVQPGRTPATGCRGGSLSFPFPAARGLRPLAHGPGQPSPQPSLCFHAHVFLPLTTTLVIMPSQCR